MEIRQIKFGDIITEPGIYEMPIEWHHSQCCAGFSVSSSGLRKIIPNGPQNSPLHFWQEYVAPKADDAEDDSEEKAAEKKHFRMGRAGHTLMLEPEKFASRYCTRPGMFKDWRTDAAKQWRLDRIKEGFTVLAPEEMKAVHGIGVALRNHRWHKEGILSGIVECSMVVKDPKTGIWIKSRPDAIPLWKVATDLKVARSAHPADVARSIRTLGYDVQMALSGVASELLGIGAVDEYWMVVVEPKAPHAIHVAALGRQMIYRGRLRIRHALDLLQDCLVKDYWPAYGEDGAEVELAQWEDDAFKKEQASGLLPKEAVF